MTIKASLTNIFCDAPHHEAANHLVHICFKIALAYLHHRLRKGALIENQFGISNEDLALDCIAELYQRDERGRFVVLEQYFRNANWASLSEEALKIALRRLVFSKVNEGLFRNYREEDPNLAKIIRNIKEAVKHDRRVKLVRARESAWLVAGPESEVNGLPLAPAEVLQKHLLTVVCETSNTYKAVGSFADFVAAHPYYCNGYPMSAFAQVLRASFINRVVIDDHTEEIAFAPVEIENAIQRAVFQVRNSLHDTYVRGGKLSKALFDNYVNAVRKVLKSTFTRCPEAIDSQFEALQTFMPDLSKEAYMNKHRNILQYLFKLSRTQMLSLLREDG